MSSSWKLRDYLLLFKYDILEIQARGTRGKRRPSQGVHVVTTYLRNEVIREVVWLHVERNINTDDLRGV